MKSANNRLNIVILDACRNDPFSRGSGGGLSPIKNANGMFVAYATEAGSVARDGAGKNGIFTKYLVKYMQEPITIEQVFKKTRYAVYKETNKQQSPGVYNQIMGEFYFTLPNQDNKTYKINKKINTNKRTYKEFSVEKNLKVGQAHAYHIMVMSYSEAIRISQALQGLNGSSLKNKFIELAKQKSEDPGTKEFGGDLGYFAKGVMVPEFENIAFTMKIGTVSQPVKSPFGYHIIYLQDRQ